MENNEIDIIKLEWNEAIRTRPGMYIGEVNTPFVLLREAIDNSIDELYGSTKTNKIYINTLGDWKVVADNGRGIPILWDEEHKMTKTQLACTSTHTGSKFNKKGVSIGLNGVGISATNALSERFVMLSKITNDNYKSSIKDVEDSYYAYGEGVYYFIEFSKGNKISEGAAPASIIKEKFDLDFPEGMSTITAFIPDNTIFKSTECKIPKKNLTYVMAIFNKIYHRVINIEINNKALSDEYTPYQFEFIKKVTSTDSKGNQREALFYVNFDCDKNMLVNDYSGSINSLITDKGVHIDAVKEAYSVAIKQVYNLTYSTVFGGLKFNVIVLATEVDFSSQTKERCTNIEGMMYFDIAKSLTGEFRKIFKQHSDFFDDHITRLNEYVATTVKLSTVNKVKAAIGTLSGDRSRTRSRVPKSVKDAYTTSRNEAELFIVEGQSASGTIINTRDPKTQAIMELRGVPMNAINVDLDEMLQNEEMLAIISAIGIGVNEYYDMTQARYGKIIIACDADSDGFRIASLILGIIAKRMNFLIQKRMVYILLSPLYIQDGKFIYPDEVDKLDRSKPYSRIKGLGELNEDEGRVVITNRDTRRLLQITTENQEEAFNLLTMTSYRKQLMIDKGIVQDPYNLGLWY